jgi:hypothetical protein
MLILWSWFVAHESLIEAFLGGATVIGIPSWLTHRGQKQAMHLANEESRRALKAQRKQFCVPFLISIHEYAPLKATLRNAHDNLWTRQKLIFQADSYVKQVNATFKATQERAAVIGSELSIDPDGQKVMDALIAYLMAQDEYLQAMLQPLRKVQTRYFGKTDKCILDELAKKGDEKLTALEEAVRLYVESSPDTDQPSQRRLSGALLKARHLVQIAQHRQKGQVKV